jgi:hypothetical protein
LTAQGCDWEDLLAQVHALVFEEAQRRFEEAQASSST